MRRFIVFSTILVSILFIQKDTHTFENATTPVETMAYMGLSLTVTHGPCDESRFEVRPSMEPESIRRRMVALIRCATDRWPVPGGIKKALDVAYCESGDNLWPWAHYMGSLGVFQQNGRYWQDRVNTYLKRDWFPGKWNRIHRVPEGAYNARANVLVSIQMAHRSGWGPWSCA